MKYDAKVVPWYCWSTIWVFFPLAMTLAPLGRDFPNKRFQQRHLYLWQLNPERVVFQLLLKPMCTHSKYNCCFGLSHFQALEIGSCSHTQSLTGCCSASATSATASVAAAASATTAATASAASASASAAAAAASVACHNRALVEHAPNNTNPCSAPSTAAAKESVRPIPRYKASREPCQ